VRALIVEDGYQRGALAACRALGRTGWKVGIASPEPGGFGASSRWAEGWHRVPSPEAGRDPFLEALQAAIAEGGYDLVFPAGDGELLAISEGRERLGAIVPYAAHDDLVRALDKLQLAEAARSAGLAVPEIVPAAEAGASFNGAVVVKPRLTTAAGEEGGALRLRAVLARTAEAAQERVDFLRSVGAEPLLQRFVPGVLSALIVVTDREGRIVVSVQQQAEMIWPREAGGSVRARVVPVDEGLEKQVGALLAELRWFGLAQVQFQPGESGEPLLIDLNARFYGSMALALASGPNLPSIWAALAIGERPPVVRLPSTGARYHWLEADLRRALVERHGGLLRDVAGSLRYARRSTHGLWDRRDPGPALRHLGWLALRRLRKFGR
jgi:predicted ATP-grasp superfamily ATP-dependent carboligase